jgi:FAD/FMN-containing dehydrogenase
MHRRNLLGGAAALGLTLLSPRWLVGAAGKSLPFRRVRPSDPRWPSSESWQRLKAAVDGNLLEVSPLLGACENGPAGPACRETVENLRNPFYIGDQPAGTQVSGWYDAWRPGQSVYAVAAREASHVVTAVNFARENNLRLVVKGGGHSYQGTSNAPDSLLIWTRAMNRVELHESFVPQGCTGRLEPQTAVSVESGAMWIDAYDAVTTRAGRYVQGGGCTSVGVAGLVQSGGFGSFSKGFGTAASGLLEAQIVTADGSLLTVNPCSHPDLFWALKGGGGGNWGVVTKLTLRTHALPQFFGDAGGTVKARSDAAMRKLLEGFLDFYSRSLFNPHWGEQVKIGPGNTLHLSMNCQGLDAAQVSVLWKPFFDWIKADPDLQVTDELHTGAGEARHCWDAVSRKSRNDDSMISDPRAAAPPTHAWWSGDKEQVGAFLYAFESAWLPASLLRQPERARLAAALFAGSRHHDIELHFNKGLAGAPEEALAAAAQTATNPEVLDAFALAIIADGGAPRYPNMPGAAADLTAPRAGADAVTRAMNELLKVAPHAGSYVSESSYFEPAWQRAHWGKHYRRLREIKAKYDPAGLFFVHHGAGSEDWSADGFTHLAPQPLIRKP